MGGPQAGIILGKKEYIDRIKKNPLTRALRIDKFSVAALEATLRIYNDGRERTAIPTIAMLTVSSEELRKKGDILCRLLAEYQDAPLLYEVELIESVAPSGGGSLPGVEFPTFVVELTPKEKRASDILAALRIGNPAILGYIHENKARFDVRTIAWDELKITASMVIKSIAEAAQ